MRVLLVAMIVGVASFDQPTPDFGSFVGNVDARWLPDNERMQLLADFAYLDPARRRWDAPKGAIVDGASIPRVFWTAIGGKFNGAYRNASVVHDVACVKKTEKWEEVHEMFYYAMRAGGVSETRAAVMYAAVYRFGPRWQTRGFWGKIFGGRSSDIGVPPPPPPPPVTEADVRALETLIEQNNPQTPEEVVQLLAKRPQ